MFVFTRELPHRPHPASPFSARGPAVCEVDGCVMLRSLSERMCNEPCFASVTFGLIDYKQRPFTMQEHHLLTLQHGFTDELTHIS